MYLLYKSKYIGLDDASILDLVAADVIEKNYYSKDERFSIAPSVLVRQYCSIIEHEVNALIQLCDIPDKPQCHLMWARMKDYVASHTIELEGSIFELNDLLEDLHELRNKAAHGGIVTKEEYEAICRYKQYGLFDLLSTTKLQRQGGKIPPSVDEISEYLSQG